MAMHLRASNSIELLLPLMRLDQIMEQFLQPREREMKERTSQQELWSLNLATESGESVLQTLSPSIRSFSSISPIGQTQ